MIKTHNIVRIIVLIFMVQLCGAESVDVPKNKPVPSHADAAVILAKYSGLFDRYVSQEATLTECVSFLNGHGIYFGLMEVVNGSEFTVKDCARVMGQIELLFTGDATFLAGKVLLPKGIASWEEFCIMHGVDYIEGYRAIVETRFFAQ